MSEARKSREHNEPRHLEPVPPADAPTIGATFAEYSGAFLAVADGTTTVTMVAQPFPPGHVCSELDARILSQAWLAKMTSTAGSELTRNEALKNKSDDEKRSWLAEYAGKYTFKSENDFAYDVLTLAADRVAFNATKAAGHYPTDAEYKDNQGPKERAKRQESRTVILTGDRVVRDAEGNPTGTRFDPTVFGKYRDLVEAEINSIVSTLPTKRTRKTKSTATAPMSEAV